MKKGLSKIKKSLDIVNLVKAQLRLEILERFLFNPQQRKLSKLNRHNYLDTGTESPSSDQDVQKLDHLIGYKLMSPMDLQLFREIY